jgi:protein-disulfide isomerase
VPGALAREEAMELESTSNRRQFILGTAAVVLAAAAGGGYYLWSRPAAEAQGGAAGGEGTFSTTDLMAPGPLGDEVLGKADAPVTIIEYASMTCPHCAHFHEAIYPEFKKRFIDTGQVRFIFREYPLDKLALAGSTLARCAGKDKFFPMVEKLFQKQREWVTQRPTEPLMAIARQAGFTQQSFDACLQNQDVIRGIEQVREQAARKFQVQSTPTFFVNGKKFGGVMTLEEIERQVAPYLKG